MTSGEFFGESLTAMRRSLIRHVLGRSQPPQSLPTQAPSLPSVKAGRLSSVDWADNQLHNYVPVFKKR